MSLILGSPVSVVSTRVPNAATSTPSFQKVYGSEALDKDEGGRMKDEEKPWLFPPLAFILAEKGCRMKKRGVANLLQVSAVLCSQGKNLPATDSTLPRKALAPFILHPSAFILAYSGGETPRRVTRPEPSARVSRVVSMGRNCCATHRAVRRCSVICGVVQRLTCGISAQGSTNWSARCSSTPAPVENHSLKPRTASSATRSIGLPRSPRPVHPPLPMVHSATTTTAAPGPWLGRSRTSASTSTP